MTPPIAGNPAFSMRMHTPSEPQVPELRMLKTVCPSCSREIALSWELQAPTRGRRTLSSVAAFWVRISAAIRGPTETKKEFRSSAGRSGWTFRPSFLPATTDLMHCHTLFGPRSPISLRSSTRRSRRTADRMTRLSSLYSYVIDSRPDDRSAARRCDIRSRVAAATGGAVGLRMVTLLRGAWSSMTGIKVFKKACHFSLTDVSLYTSSQSTVRRS